MISTERYSRQNRVADYDHQAQARLGAAQVLIVGAGGLGGPVAAALVGAGTGTTTLIDHDSVTLSNLHRQWFFSEAGINQPKADQLANHLRRLNSDVSVGAIVARLAPDNVMALIEDHDLIVDAADNFPTSLLLSDACRAASKPLLTASVNQLYGYTGLLCGERGPSLRAIFPRIPKQQTSCDVVGVVGPAVGAVAGLQAQIALDTLAQARDRQGWMHYLDLRDFNLRSIDCRLAKEPDETTVGFVTESQIREDDWVIDVREPDETLATPQPVTTHQRLPLSSFDKDQIEPVKTRIVMACQSGQRALIAAQQVIDAGHKNVAVMVPGNHT
jgi:molybdopterin/thiamine biosynthesis adenylyltransferase/rhodanese-related sulfurtransferase